MQKHITRKPSQITTEIVTVTPDIADSWLEKNEHNRRTAYATITKFARDMERGNWQLTGDAIRFDVNGCLIDGQHRLLACRKAKQPFKTFVMYGLDPETQDVMDTGKVRRVQDVLSLRGLTNANQLAAAVRALAAYRDGAASGRAMAYTTADLIDTFESHPNITKSVAQANNGLPRAAPRGTIAILHYLSTTYLNDPESASRLVDVFRTGVPSYHGDVMHVMRERFIRFPTDGHKIKHEIAVNTMHHAWNLFVQKKSIGVLRWQKEFVEIDGIDRSKL